MLSRAINNVRVGGFRHCFWAYELEGMGFVQMSLWIAGSEVPRRNLKAHERIARSYGGGWANGTSRVICCKPNEQLLSLTSSTQAGARPLNLNSLNRCRPKSPKRWHAFWDLCWRIESKQCREKACLNHTGAEQKVADLSG